MAKKTNIPKHAKKVFEGVIFNVYQWEQELFDGTKATFERLTRPDLTLVIPVTEDKKIIILSQVQPGTSKYLSVAGGRIEKGENPRTGAKRELLEETGFTPKKLVLWQKIKPMSKIDFTIYTYIAKGCKKVTNPHLDPGEKITTKLVSFEEFLNICLDKNFVELNITNEILKAMLDPKKLKELKDQFLG